MQINVAQVIVAVVIFTSLGGCRRAPELRPRLILQGEEEGKEFWLAAPYVLVVKIIGAAEQGSPEPIFHGGPKTLQLIRFDASVENLIKGDNLPNKITFFFFEKLDQKPRYDLDPGNRYIVSLRSEGGVLRSFADAKQLRIEVDTGLHIQKDLPLGLGPEATITYILLTPGVDVDPRAFRSSLNWPMYGDPAYVNLLLKQLELSSDSALSYSACLTSAQIFWHRPKCLEQALESPDSNIRKSAADFIKEDQVHLLERLEANPFFLSNQASTDYSLELLEIFAEDTRPEVRKAACASLRSLTPQRVGERCR